MLWRFSDCGAFCIVLMLSTFISGTSPEHAYPLTQKALQKRGGE